MKRKYRHRSARLDKDPSPRTFGEGIPRLRRTISETGPSIPSEEEHAAVSFTEAAFGLLSEDDWDYMSQKSSRLYANSQGELVYSSENDVAAHVKTFMSAVLQAMGLADAVELHSEIGTFNVRPDIWVVSIDGVPIGVIEVKKPDVPGKPSGMSHPNILGELYDFLKHLPNFYGVSPCFGILTNLESWRTAWLPIDGDTGLAAEEEQIVDEDADGDGEEDDENEMTAASSSSRVESHFIHHEDTVDPSEEDCDVLDSSPRHLFVSTIFHKSDPSTLVRAVSSAIKKMLRSDLHPFSNPFDKLAERSILKFIKGSEKATYWTRLNVKPKWDIVANPKKFLFAIQDLGRGSDGRVWLTSSSKGSVCVLKFALSRELSDTIKEMNFWNRAYPDIKVQAEIWCGHPALRMPYFCQEYDNLDTALDLVRACLLTNFAQKGLIHNDVYWRNVGFYKTNSGSQTAVVFDLLSVEEMEDKTDFSWVERVCQVLRSDHKKR